MGKWHKLWRSDIELINYKFVLKRKCKLVLTLNYMQEAKVSHLLKGISQENVGCLGSHQQDVLGEWHTRCLITRLEAIILKEVQMLKEVRVRLSSRWAREREWDIDNANCRCWHKWGTLHLDMSCKLVSSRPNQPSLHTWAHPKIFA